MKTTSHLAMVSLTARLCALVAVLLTVTASAVDLTTQKLFGKWSLTPTSFFMGSYQRSAALSPKWAVVGVAQAADRSQTDEGAVQVFNAATGAFVRKLLPPVAPLATQRFGASVAISGDIGVVGAPSANGNKGQAFVYNLATGALLRTLSAADGAIGDFFGSCVATNGETVVVTAPYDDAFRGSFYLFKASTGAQIAKIQPAGGAPNDYLGYAGLALEGDIVAVGADGSDGSRGAVYFYSLSTQTLIKKYQPAAWVGGNAYGSALSMHQGRVAIGSFLGTGHCYFHNLATGGEGPLDPGVAVGSLYGGSVAVSGPFMAVGDSNIAQGRVHLFRSSDGGFIRTILPPNGDTSAQRFGFSIALDGTTLLATAPDDGAQAIGAGAAHLIGPLTQPMAFTKVVAKGDFAPGAPDISYGTLGDAFTNATQAVTFTSTLTGANSNAGKDYGVFSDIKTANSQEMLFKSRQLYSGTAIFGTPSAVSSNDDELAIGLSTLTGGGVTASNNLLLWFKTNTTQGTLLRTGTAVTAGALTGFVPTTIAEAVTSNRQGHRGMAAICTLKVGTAGVTAGTDSGLYSNKVGIDDEFLAEGALAVSPLPAGSKYGQFAPRVANNFRMQVFSTALTDTGITTATNAAVLRKEHGSAAIVVAQKGVTAVTDKDGNTLSGVNYSAFIGESANGNAGAVYRATIIGTNVTAANNEGVWNLDSVPNRRLAFRKGQTLVPLPGVTIARIINFWGIGYDSADSTQVLALVQLAGTGVNATNDQALISFQNEGTHNVLLREGDPAPGCPGARIGVISRIEADAWATSYAVLATLTGATTTSDLALYTGNVIRGNSTDQAQLRRPFLRLRKGQLFDNQPSKVKSIYLPSSSVTASGAGGTGRGRAIAWNNSFAFTVEFDNGIRQVMKGSVE